MSLQISKNRIIYEAFSNFSGNLSKAKSIDEIASVTQKYLKYLFNFNVFRICLIEGTSKNLFTSFLDQSWIEKDTLLPYEKQILDTKLPVQGNLQIKQIENYLAHHTLEAPEFLGWYFQYENLQICASVIVDVHTKFDFSNIEVLNMFVDSLASKYKNVRLGYKLEKKNINLENAIKTIETKKHEIEKIIKEQQVIIDERTKDLRTKNQRLYEISSLNAHNLREPLSRILGLLDVSDTLAPEEIKETILAYIKTSAQDLDTTLKEVISKSAKEIEGLKFN